MDLVRSQLDRVQLVAEVLAGGGKILAGFACEFPEIYHWTMEQAEDVIEALDKKGMLR